MPPKKFMDALDAGLSSDDSDEEQQDVDGGEEEQAPAEKKQKQTIDVNLLNKHGYGDGPSVLLVPEKHEDNQNWQWGSGIDKKQAEAKVETYEEREQNRAAVTTKAEESAQFAVQQRQQAKILQEARYLERKAMKQRDMPQKQKDKRKRDADKHEIGKGFIEDGEG